MANLLDFYHVLWYNHGEGGGAVRIFGRVWIPSETGIGGLFYCLVSPIKVFAESIKSLLAWFPIIWKDRNWDQYYLYKILRTKISMMSDYHKNFGHTEDAKKISEQMKLAADLIKKLENDDYYDEALIPLYKKYPDFDLKIDFVKEKNSKFGEIKFDYGGEERETLHRECLMKEPSLRNADRKKLFDMISDNIDSWWD